MVSYIVDIFHMRTLINKFFTIHEQPNGEEENQGDEKMNNNEKMSNNSKEINIKMKDMIK